jgi:hypothetical protein
MGLGTFVLASKTEPPAVGKILALQKEGECGILYILRLDDH